MKNIFKKNQIIITALAIMIAVAGYLNFTQDKISETASNGDSTNTTEMTGTKDADASGVIKDETEKVLGETDVIDSGTLDVSSEDMLNMEVGDNGEILVTGEESVENLQTADSGEVDKTGEAVLVDNSLGNNFFASAKLNREQTRAKNKETLMSIVNSSELTENQKKDAINSIIDMTAIAEKENATETLLNAKGYENCVVSIVDGTVDVVVAGKDLTEQQITQIEDVVKRKTEIESKNIVITPVNNTVTTAE